MTLGKLTFSNGELDMLDRDAFDDDLGIEIQSGSSVRPKGFEGRLGLSPTACPFLGLGTGTAARAGCLLSSHHFWRSELAGGSPGSIES
jgi:hypothetical protein